MAHVPVPRGLELPRRYRHVPTYLQMHDADLRLRRSVEMPAFFILERRVRRRPAVNLGMRLLSDLHIQAAHGYLHVATVHYTYLERPWRMFEELKESGADLWAARTFGKSGADAIEDEEAYEQQWQKETLKRRRHERFQAIARESFDILSRTGNRDGTERTRLNNPGIGGGDPRGRSTDERRTQATAGQ